MSARSPLPTAQLVRAKRRVTHRLIKADLRRLKRHDGVREKRWARCRLHRLDLVLEARGELAGATWYPGARRKPGLNANYRRGRVLARCVKEHYTVGRNSGPLIQTKGLAQFLVNRDGTIDQFAPADAVCSDSCEWAIEGPGIENECMDRGQLNAAMIRANIGLHRWLHDTYGYPYRWYGGARRLAVGNPEGYGFVNHGSLIHRKCDMHSDGLTESEARQIIDGARGTSAALLPQEDPMFASVTVTSPGVVESWLVDGGVPCHRFGGKPDPTYAIPQEALDFVSQQKVPLVTLTVAELADAKKRMVPAVGGPVTVNNPPIDYDKLADAVKRGVNAAETS